MRRPSGVPFPLDVLLCFRLALLWCMGLLPGYAQTDAFRHFDYRDGLPQSQVLALMEDRGGFLWIGTQDGVARLGASGFQVFGPDEGLRARMVSPAGLLQARDGAIWVASQESGVGRIQGSRVTSFGKAEGLDPEATYAIAEDAGGTLYTANQGGLFRFQAERFQRVALPPPWHQFPIFSMAADSRGGLWLGSRKGHLAYWDGSSLAESILPEPYRESPVLQLRQGPEGRIWALFRQGLLRQSATGTWETVPLEGFRGRPRLHAFHFNERGDLAIAMGGDGVYLARRGEPTRILDYRHGLSRDATLSALIDARGTLWVGSDGNYLSAFILPGLRTIARDPETGAEYGIGAVLRFLQVGPGDMLIASNTGLTRWRIGRGIVQRWTMAQGLPSNDIWSLEHDGRGGVWIGTTKGVVRMIQGRITPGPAELATEAAGIIARYGSRIWVGTDRGLYEFNPEGTLVALHTPPEEVGLPAVFTLLPTSEGIYAGTRAGLYLLKDGRFSRPPGLEPVTGALISTLYQDSSGSLWVGTSEGLYRREPLPQGTRWKRFGLAEGLLHETINWIQALPSGTLAVGTGKGISFLRDGDFRHLTRNMGLLSDETNQDAVHLDPEGRLWIGMIGGVCILEPESVIPSAALPPPKVLEATWGTGATWLPSRLALPNKPGTLQLSFDVGLPSPAVPCRFQVWMEGLDKTWRALDGTSANTLRIAQLAAGSYRFRIRASMDGIHWVESQPFPITVARAWYQLPWVQFLLVLAGLGLLALLLQLRTRALRRRADLLESRIQERTAALESQNRSLERLHAQLKRTLESRIQIMNTVAHDLRSPLTSILISVERLQEADEPGPILPRSLTVMDREARRLESILASLLNQARAESAAESLSLRLCRPTEILHGLTETLGLKAESRGLTAEVSLDPGSDQVWILADVTALQQVLFNLLENALKFTEPPGRVGVTTRMRGQEWLLEVWDTGRGIEADQQAAIFEAFRQAQDADTASGWGLGLAICRSLVEAHEGQIELESEPGKGSTFRVVLPLVQPQKPA